MIDGRYDDAEWRDIRSHVPDDVVTDEALRQALDSAAASYCERRRTTGGMGVANKQGRRKKWESIEQTAQKLLDQLSDVGEWNTSLWSDDETQRVAAIEDVKRIIVTAQGNLEEYGVYAKSFQRRQDPDKE